MDDNTFESYRRAREIEDDIKYDKVHSEISNNPLATIEQLWMLPEEFFFDWRRKFDYPKLLESFNATKPNYTRWKKAYGLTDEDVMSYKVSSFLEHAKKQKSQTLLYFLEQIFDGKKRRIVAYEDLSKQNGSFPDDCEESYTLIKSFHSYSDWCDKNNVPFDLFTIKKRRGANHSSERVWLDSGYELLKMGGIKPPRNAFGIMLRGKHFEFTNLCGLELSGKYIFGSEGNLQFSYSTLDNWRCKELEFNDNIFFNECRMGNFSCNDSKISNWRFNQCRISGEIINTKLQNIKITGGYFTPHILNCQFIEVHADQSDFWNGSFKYTFSLFKKIYNDQGDDDQVSKYYIKEKEVDRQHSRGFAFMFKTISYYYWGYGKRPINVIYFSVLTIILCAMIYQYFPGYITMSSRTKVNGFLDMLYFSTVTFTTLGYGDIAPLGPLRILALLEAFSGALTIGFLVAGFSRSKY